MKIWMVEVSYSNGSEHLNVIVEANTKRRAKELAIQEVYNQRGIDLSLIKSAKVVK